MMKTSIYTASKTRHAPKWLELRNQGVNIISTWIDEYLPGMTNDFADLAVRCVSEPAKADVTILYCEPNDYLKFALVEVGAALAAGKKVIVIGECPSVSCTLARHPNILTANSIHDALIAAENLE